MKPEKTRKWGRPDRPAARRDHAPDPDYVRLYGVHAVEAALGNSRRRVRRLLATENAARRLAEAIAGRGITPEPASPRDLDRILGAEAVHQGVMLEADDLDGVELSELAAAAARGPLLLLDHVTDPHNVGAILRSAAAFGAAGLVMTRRHSPRLDGTLAKAASGALDVLPIALVQNLARAMEDLKEAGVRIVGLDDAATDKLQDEPFAGPVAIVLGAEGKGLRELTAQTCDRLVRIATVGTFASLNVSNAAAVAMHMAALRRS